MRIAFTGASGTGKTLLAEHLTKKFGLTFNPVGSRSVAIAMGFERPYDVDAAGKRAEFQTRLVDDKVAWEAEHEGFVTDRTTVDNLTYTIMHDVYAITPELLAKISRGMARYTHIIHCPVSAFCNPGGDESRVQDLTYHEICDMVLKSALDKYGAQHRVYTLHESSIEARLRWLDKMIRPTSNGLSRSFSSDGLY